MKSHLRIILAVVCVLVLTTGILVWYKLYHVVAQPAWIASDQRDNYYYGSVGNTGSAGLPYWLWLAMPRLFPEYMPRPGGYAALGMAWEEGREMPVGFAKQRVGYIRVTGNCALCHAMPNGDWRDEVPKVISFEKGKSNPIEPLLTFYTRCAQDPRFNADELLSEIDNDTKLSWIDRLLYRYVFIPRIRKRLIDDPASILFSPEIRGHALNPQSEAYLSDPQIKAFSEWMKQQSQQAKP